MAQRPICRFVIQAAGRRTGTEAPGTSGGCMKSVRQVTAGARSAKICRDDVRWVIDVSRKDGMVPNWPVWFAVRL
jgi:hypothetical protein